MESHSFHPHPIVGVVKSAFIAIILSILILFVSLTAGDWFLVFLVIVWGWAILQMLLLFLISRHHQVILEETSVTYKSGILSHHRTVLPYARITEASYSQGVLQRFLGVGTLKLDTAGGSSVAIYIHDIKFNDLKMILGEIKEKSVRDEGE